MTETLRETPIAELAAKVLTKIRDGWRMRLDRPDGLETDCIPPHVAQAALSAAREEAAEAERERAARVAEQGCLVPPDGGSPTEDEREMCDRIAAAIRKGEDTSHE